MSKMHAKHLILGHTQTGMGERIRAKKIQALLQASGKKTPILDLLHLLENLYEPLAHLNFALADQNLPLIENINLPDAIRIKKQIEAFKPELLFILSWGFSLAALFALGIHKICPTIATLCTHHANEQIFPMLYEPADLLITESLLANERGIAYGIPAGKILFLPHPFPLCCSRIKPNRTYVQKLASSLGKCVSDEALVIGCASRLDYGKNCEFALDTVSQLVGQGHNVVFVLKGDITESNTSPYYADYLLKLLKEYESEPWLLWDKTSTGYPSVIDEYASFDLCLLLSGAECGSHVVSEWMAIGKPIIVLDCSTHRSLYGEGLVYINTRELIDAQMPFFAPDREDLLNKVEALIKDKTLRSYKGELAKKIAFQRFHPIEISKRLSLLQERNEKAIEKLYARDRKAYGL